MFHHIAAIGGASLSSLYVLNAIPIFKLYFLLRYVQKNNYLFINHTSLIGGATKSGAFI